MTVFKTFLKIVKKQKAMVILYTVILVVFAGTSTKTNDTSSDFTASKPTVMIINNDEENKITDNLVNYMKDKCEIANLENNEDKIDDALFYRQVSYVIYIPENYGSNILKGENPEINIKTNNLYSSKIAELTLSKYVKLQNTYISMYDNEDKLIETINDTLSKNVEIEKTSAIDTTKEEQLAFFYNFAAYSVMAGLIFVICLILASFNEEKVRKRTIISSMNYKKHNRELLLSSLLYTIALWFIYVILARVLQGKIVFTTKGLLYVANLFVFTICALTIAMLISTLVNNKDAINGIVNVVALGSSFLCGVFVPSEWLPDSILKIAHILPTYWYVNANDRLKTIEELNLETLKPVFINMGVVLGFAILFIILNNVVAKRKQKIA